MRVLVWRWDRQSRRFPRSAEPGRVLAASDRVRLPAQRLGDLAARARVPARRCGRARAGAGHAWRNRRRQRRGSRALGRWRRHRAGAERRWSEPDRSAHLALARPLGGRCADVSGRRRRERRRGSARPVRVSTAGTWGGARRPGADPPRRGRRGMRGDGPRAVSARCRRSRAGARGRTRDGAPNTDRSCRRAIATEMQRSARFLYRQDVGRMGGSLGTQGP